MKHKFLALLALFVIVACVPAAVSLVGLIFAVVRSPSFDIVARKNSPDHLLDAVHVMPRTNATMGFVHWVYVTGAGDVIPDYRFFIPDADNRIFAAEKVDGEISLTWTTNSELNIRAKSARVFKSKGAVIRMPDGETRQITVRLDIDDLRRP
jgi:hypothetical protein